MNELIFLGTCSGTEPMIGMHHTSILLKINEALYFFDCGEGCGYSSYTMLGKEIASTKAIFISHQHVDHIGGFSHLLSVLNGMAYFFPDSQIANCGLDVFIPSSEIFSAIKLIGFADERQRFEIREYGISDGKIYEDENIKVTALHNRHLGDKGEAGWKSFSYLIEAAGKKIVFSGDTREISEVDSLIGEGCDIFIMETGHHKVAKVIDYAAQKPVGALYFSHHGREIINDRPAMQKLVSEHKQNAFIAHDGLRINL